jgi:hypothetical protein
MEASGGLGLCYHSEAVCADHRGRTESLLCLSRAIFVGPGWLCTGGTDSNVCLCQVWDPALGEKLQAEEADTEAGLRHSIGVCGVFPSTGDRLFTSTNIISFFPHIL